MPQTKPVGIMACFDIQTRRPLDACREADAAVPEEAAVPAVDDDRLLCNLCSPPLSSAIPKAPRTGYTAAELLRRLMNGEDVLNREHVIPPTGMSERQSTDVPAIDGREVAAAVRYIGEQACDGLDASAVVRQASVSRRASESRFRKALGRTPHEELERVRMERIKQLLAETDLTPEAIARRTGFRHVEYLSVVFKRETGEAPGRFRAGNGAAAPRLTSPRHRSRPDFPDPSP